MSTFFFASSFGNHPVSFISQGYHALLCFKKVNSYQNFCLPGRNLALKKETLQGEQTYNKTASGESYKAVDGNTDGNYEYGRSCTHTNAYGFVYFKYQALDSWWKVTVGENLFIWRIKVFNRDDKRK